MAVQHRGGSNVVAATGEADGDRNDALGECAGETFMDPTGENGHTPDFRLEARVARIVTGWVEDACRPTYSRGELYGELYGDEHPFRPVSCDHCAGLILDRMTELGWSYELYADTREKVQNARFFRVANEERTGAAVHVTAVPVSGDARRRSICHAAMIAMEGRPIPPQSMPC